MKQFITPIRQDDSQAGFTIVELMIATAVFSLVLLVILYGVLNFSHAYFSGVNSATTQTTARTIINDVTESIEFSGANIQSTPVSEQAGVAYYFCAGGATYYYVLGAMYDGAAPSSTDPGLYMQQGICTANPDFSSPKGKELLGANLRVTYLTVTQSTANPRLYTVGLGLAYGESDLLCSISQGTQPGGCVTSATPNPQHVNVIGSSPSDVNCRQVTGYQFCAHAGLSTTVSLRVANSDLGS